MANPGWSRADLWGKRFFKSLNQYSKEADLSLNESDQAWSQVDLRKNVEN